MKCIRKYLVCFPIFWFPIHNLHATITDVHLDLQKILRLSFSKTDNQI